MRKQIEQEEAWKALRELLANHQHARLQLILLRGQDASKVGIGGVLIQKIDYSKETDSAEVNRGSHKYISFVTRYCQTGSGTFGCCHVVKNSKRICLKFIKSFFEYIVLKLIGEKKRNQIK